MVSVGRKRETYKKQAQELKIADAVRFVGNVPDGDLAALYNCAALYRGVSRRADGSRVEGFGVALAEASACGVPVIAGNSGGLPEAVKDGETGLIVEPDNLDAVTEALERLLTDQLLARRFGQAGRTAGETTSTWDPLLPARASTPTPVALL